MHVCSEKKYHSEMLFYLQSVALMKYQGGKLYANFRLHLFTCLYFVVLLFFFSQDPNMTSVSVWTRSSHLKRPRIRKNSQESQSETSQGVEENALQVSESRQRSPYFTDFIFFFFNFVWEVTKYISVSQCATGYFFSFLPTLLV